MVEKTVYHPRPRSKRASRDKGDRFERHCVAQLQALGVHAKRMPLSGSAGGDFAHDLRVVVREQELPVECKDRHAMSLADFYKWLAQGPRYLFLRRTFPSRPAGDTLVLMSIEEFARLVRPDPADWSV